MKEDKKVLNKDLLFKRIKKYIKQFNDEGQTDDDVLLESGYAILKDIAIENELFSKKQLDSLL